MEYTKQVLTHVLERYNNCGSKKVNMYDVHVKYVVEYAKELAKKLNADEEIVEISALLHDIARLDGLDEEHHIEGAKYADKYLRSIGYPLEKIEMVKHCIYAHRGSTDIKRESIEAECVASADAMSHFKDISGMFYFVYGELGKDMEEGKSMIKAKLERSYKKLIPEAREIFDEKYSAIIKVLE